MPFHKNTFPCIICPGHFPSKPEQADHLATAHSFTQPWLCHQCSQSFKAKDDLDTHKSTAHPQSGGVSNKHQCSLPACGLRFASETMVIRHRQQDHTQQAARIGKGLKRGCTQRGCQYTNESCVAFSVHLLHLHQPKCTVCGEKFEEFAELQKHRNGPGKDGMCARTTAEPSRGSITASSKGTTVDIRSENGHISSTPSPAVHQSSSSSQGLARVILRGITSVEAGRAASSSSTMVNIRSEYGHANPASARTELAPMWLPTDGRYGSLLDDSPAFVSYDPLQHDLLNWALGDWEKPTDLMSAPAVSKWQPVAGNVVSPSPLPMPVPLTQPAWQQQQPQDQGDSVDLPEQETLQPQQATFVADPPLPQSVLERGYTDDDFDPSKVWDTRMADKIGHRDYPSDLQDKHIFNGDPHLIRYGNILRLSTKYSNVRIYERSNKDREQPAFTSKATIDCRITAAIKWAAEKWEMPGGYDDVVAWLDGERVKNGLRPRQKKRKREQDEHSHTVEVNQGDRVCAMPSKRINTAETAETTLHSQLQQFLHPTQAPSTPAQQTAGSVHYSTLPTPAATPGSTNSTLSTGQKKRKRADYEQTHTLGTDPDGRIFATSSKRINTGETMSTPQAHAFLQLKQALSAPARQTASLAQYAAASSPMTTATGLARTAAIQEAAMLTPPRIMPGSESEDIHGLRGSIWRNHLEQHRSNDAVSAANVARFDSPMAPYTPSSNISIYEVIDLTGDE